MLKGKMVGNIKYWSWDDLMLKLIQWKNCRGEGIGFLARSRMIEYNENGSSPINFSFSKE